MDATRQEEVSSGGRDRLLRRGLCLAFFIFIFISLALAQPSGWLKVCTRKSCFYKAFIETKPNHLVFFITPEGKIYKAKCKKHLKSNKCKAVTSKRFYSSADELLYIEVKLKNPPELISYGTVDPLNEIRINK
ncbi:conserved hypothetical protein [Thermosulfidibacter takaii ABI70S6]|uniref:Uncharacterized protein n=1 Tax=Thermosulfidibacter takaii (strain DSM 17441 / JCM 13301 / NBRC 103674 / ABI70S6) TaxID=1298851 RepID=A0A0S3QRQ1_THET7|nr:conserved hypothetical protein [Thermosulfidibacter takaii ABI70S6]